jgi:hypothetical protein
VPLVRDRPSRIIESSRPAMLAAPLTLGSPGRCPLRHHDVAFTCSAPWNEPVAPAPTRHALVAREHAARAHLPASSASSGSRADCGAWRHAGHLLAHFRSTRHTGAPTARPRSGTRLDPRRPWRQPSVDARRGPSSASMSAPSVRAGTWAAGAPAGKGRSVSRSGRRRFRSARAAPSGRYPRPAHPRRVEPHRFRGARHPVRTDRTR